MAQAAKFIDVTRSFLPIDPNAYPETMHGTAKEDAPENRIPANAYIGQNFMPTSYGYKSYFGTNGKLNIDDLTSRVDFVFIFQNEVRDNKLVALCEDGIWIKDGGSTGAWTHAYVIAPDMSPLIHYDWTYVIISDELYCYMQGKGTYQKIVSSATAPGYILSSVAPTFLNMAGQMGIFQAGGRLGFWDSADSVAWSNLDDLGDFEPSIETLAGNTLFTDVKGRIVTIIPHGRGFIIYASASVVYVEANTEATFEWKPEVLLKDTGIAYPLEVCAAIPNTLHFAYTNTGLYKISKTIPEVIVPEVTDFLKEAEGPVYPKVLQGRYLFLQLFDDNYITGLASFKDVVVPAVSYYFPGAKSLVEAIEDVILRGNDLCGVYDAVNNAEFQDQQPGGANGGPPIADIKPGTKAKPIWKCYISKRAGAPEDIEFTSDPCGQVGPSGKVMHMSPSTQGNRLDKMTQDSSNKIGLNGSDVYIDGIWTIERFVSVQTAIWDKEQAQLSAFIDRILNRADTDTKETDVGSCTPADPPRGECVIGDFVSHYSGPKFGLSACQFWLTRYALAAVTIKTISKSFTLCDFIPSVEVNPTSFSTWSVSPPGGGSYASSTIACNSNPGGPYFTLTANNDISVACCTNSSGSCAASSTASRSFTCPTGPAGVVSSTRIVPISGTLSGNVTVGVCTQNAYYKKTETLYVYNQAVDKAIAPTPETAYCEIVGWEYTANDNTTKTTTASTCVAPQAAPKKNGPPLGIGDAVPSDLSSPDTLLAGNGEMCAKPFEPIVIPGLPDGSVVWPDQTVTLPPGQFLLQAGSLAPLYPLLPGALVYDLQLKKWGKMKLDYKQLLDYQPVNNWAGGGVPYNNFGILAGVMKAGGSIYLFDEDPEDSYITYGKIGYYRLGVTEPQEVRVHFRTVSSGTLRLDTSLGGRFLGAGLTKSVDFTNVGQAQLDGGFPGSWMNITISGKYDISYLEFRGITKGRRT
jgi:hypothetical protein